MRPILAAVLTVAGMAAGAGAVLHYYERIVIPELHARHDADVRDKDLTILSLDDQLAAPKNIVVSPGHGALIAGIKVSSGGGDSPGVKWDFIYAVGDAAFLRAQGFDPLVCERYAGPTDWLYCERTELP